MTMRNIFYMVLTCSFILIGCQKESEAPIECILENIAEVNFIRLEDFGIIHSVMEEADETIILSYYPKVLLTGLANDSFDPIWSNNYALHTTARGNDLLRNQNGNFAIAGEKFGRKSWILECNQFEKDINEFEDNSNIKNSINAITEIEGGDIISLGKVHPGGGALNHNIQIRRVKNDGTVVWEQSIVRSSIDSGLEILKLNNNNLLLCYEWRENILGSGIGFIELTIDGNIVREQKKENFKELSTLYMKFIESADGGILVGATNTVNITQQYNPLTIKLNQNFEVEWSSENGNTENSQFVEGIKELSNGDVLVFGSSRNQCTEGLNMYISRLNSVGNLLWQKTYGDNYWSTAKYVVERENGN